MTDNPKPIPQQPLYDNGPSRLPMFRNMNPDACDRCGSKTCDGLRCVRMDREADRTNRWRDR
jgi:hypothetical protein